MKYSKYYVLIDAPALEGERVRRGDSIGSYAAFLGISEPTYHSIKKRGYATIGSGGKIAQVLPHVIGKTLHTSELVSSGS